MQHKSNPAERRAFGRRESCVRAVIEVAGRPPVHCVVRNYSRGGALLEVAEPIGIDDNLHLVIETHGIATYCDVRHRNGNHIGVRFLTEMSEERAASLAAASVNASVAADASAGAASGASLRKSLFGVSPPVEAPKMVRAFKANAVLRYP